MRGSVGEQALHADTRARRDLRHRLVLLALPGSRLRVDDLELRVKEPAQEVEVMRGEIEEHAASGRPGAFPLGQASFAHRLAEGRLHVANVTDTAALEHRPGLLVDRVKAPVEAHRRDHARARDRIEHVVRVGFVRGKRLLDVDVLSGPSRCGGKCRMQPGRSSDDDSVHVGARQQLPRVGVGGCSRSDPGSSRPGGWIGICEAHDRRRRRSSQGREMMRTRDRPAAEQTDPHRHRVSPGYSGADGSRIPSSAGRRSRPSRRGTRRAPPPR